MIIKKKSVFILQDRGNAWIPFLQEFFEDTSAEVVIYNDASSAASWLNKNYPNTLFINPKLLTSAVTQKIKVLQQTTPSTRIFSLDTDTSFRDISFDAVFLVKPALVDFQKQVVELLPLQENIRVLVVDDEPEIGNMLRDFLERRVGPAFEIRIAHDGEEGLAMMEKDLPDVLVLDIKMPVKDGREVYREIIKRQWPVSVIVFFDAISGDEMSEMHKYGKPAVIDKGSRQSALPELMSLIKKKSFFG